MKKTTTQKTIKNPDKIKEIERLDFHTHSFEKIKLYDVKNDELVENEHFIIKRHRKMLEDGEEKDIKNIYKIYPDCINSFCIKLIDLQSRYPASQAFHYAIENAKNDGRIYE